MTFDFSGQTIIVTGAAHGFGRAIALAFASLGGNVWACDVNRDGLTQTEAEADGLSGSVKTRSVDVSDKTAVEAFVQEATEERGVEILVNNAGGVLGQVRQPLEQVSAEDWSRIFGVNVDGAFYFAQAVAPAMKAARFGRIINISSGAGLSVSLTGIQAYAAAKAAQIGLTRQLAHELGPWNITVNNIAPGFVRSNPTTEKQWQSYGEAGQQAFVENIALRRLGIPEDIANGVLFFASPYASWVTGQVLSVDGGK